MEASKLNSLKKAGSVASAAHAEVAKIIRPGVNILDIERLVRSVISDNGLEPAFEGYKGYPAASCISVNEEIVHGLPINRELMDGDIVAVDLGVTCNGWMVDTARTHPVGNVAKNILLLLSATEDALDMALKVAKAGYRTGDIGNTVNTVVTKYGFHVVKELTGHGVGRTLQEEPTVPNFGKSGTGTVLKKDVVIAIEPITSMLPVEISILSDDWTIVASPPCPTAHFEHTVIITDGLPIVLTK